LAGRVACLRDGRRCTGFADLSTRHQRRCRRRRTSCRARYAFDLINAVEVRGQHAVEEHDEILQAPTTGGAASAMLAMRKHIEPGWAVLKAA